MIFHSKLLVYPTVSILYVKKICSRSLRTICQNPTPERNWKGSQKISRLKQMQGALDRAVQEVYRPSLPDAPRFLIWGKLCQCFLAGEEFAAQLEFFFERWQTSKPRGVLNTLGLGQRWECPSWPNLADLACEGRASWVLFTTTLEDFGAGWWASGNMMSSSSVIFQVRDSRCFSIWVLGQQHIHNVIDLTKKAAWAETRLVATAALIGWLNSIPLPV